MRHLFTSLLLFIFVNISAFGQTSKDAVVPVSATVDVGLPQVTLNWELNTATADLLLIRREKDADTWFIMLDSMGADITTFTDPFVSAGQVYEYGIIRSANGIPAFGYITVSLESPMVDSRGTMLVFVEDALQTPLAAELQRLEYDLVGDGWKVIWHPQTADATVASVKSQIVADYTADPTGVKSVLLLGELPVPYSGDTAWDGHTNHQGAWPADSYYGDVDGVWTDSIVNNTTPSRAANVNVPGDGKFDQSITPSNIEIAVGRVDFSNLSETTFGTTRTELLRRYLNKNHNWRTKQYTVSQQGFVDDNFGYFGGEAFAANGYRNFYPVVGQDSVMDADFFTDTNSQSYLFGYGCGGGSYTSANGVGTSDNFASDTVNVVFSMLFGSYHGDWDSENNPFMPSALASKGGILSCSWAGRPHWFNHALAAGETLGYCALATENSCDNVGYFGTFGDCGAHVTLLGDPSLRVHVVDPVTDVAAVRDCNTIDLTWTASAAPNMEGYLVYRASSLQGDFSRLTPQPVPETSFTDNSPMDGDNYYQVRAVVLQTTPSGSYFNTSTGTIIDFHFEAGSVPNIDIAAETMTCLNQTPTISASTDAAQPTFFWSGPGNFTSTDSIITVDQAGTYLLTVTNGVTGCSSSVDVVVEQDLSLPVADPVAGSFIGCQNAPVQLFANPDMPGYAFEWSGPNGFSSNLENPMVSEPGAYIVIVTAPNGCVGAWDTEVLENFTEPTAIVTSGILTCLSPEIALDGTGSSAGPTFVYQWTTIGGNIVSGENTLFPVVNACGTYVLAVVDLTNGCTSSADVVVTCDFEIPDLSIEGQDEILCFGDSATFTASSMSAGATFLWEGPGITEPTLPTQTVGYGFYTVTVTGANGCTNENSFGVFGPDQLSVSVQTAFIDCEGFIDVNILATGGTPPYAYSFVPMPPFPPNTTYEVIVTDANGCSTSVSATTPDFIPMELTVTHTDETIFGLNDGTATANVTNGGALFSYSWSNGADTQTITNLAPGEYSVTITDENGCEATATVEILEGALAADDIQGLESLSIFPNPSNGVFEVSIKLAYAQPVSLEILDIIGHVLHSVPGEMTTGKSWPIDLMGLPPGNYLCKITIGGQVVSRRIILL